MARRRRKNQKWLIGGLILVILAAVGIGVAVIWNNEHQESEQAEEMEVTEAEEMKDVEKRDGETEEEYSERMAEQKRVKQYEGEDPNKAEELSGAVTYAGVKNGTLMVGVNIDQFLADGSCELSLVRDNNVVYTDSVDIVADVSTSSCDGFSVPVSGLGSGTTEIIVKLSANGKTGAIRGEVDI